MTKSLNSLIGQVRRSCLQVIATGSSITESARQLEVNATEQAASMSQVSATTSVTARLVAIEEEVDNI